MSGKRKRKAEEWHVNRKAVAALQTAGLFCHTEGLFLTECDLISNTEFPSSPFSAAVTHSIARMRERETVNLIASQGSVWIPAFDKWLGGSHLKVSWELRVMATPVFLSWRKYWDLFSCIHHKPH